MPATLWFFRRSLAASEPGIAFRISERDIASRQIRRDIVVGLRLQMFFKKSKNAFVFKFVSACVCVEFKPVADS